MKTLIEKAVEYLSLNEAQDTPKVGDAVGYPVGSNLVRGTLSKYNPDKNSFEITWDEKENMANKWFIGRLNLVSFHQDKYVKNLKPGQNYFNISK